MLRNPKMLAALAALVRMPGQFVEAIHNSAVDFGKFLSRVNADDRPPGTNGSKRNGRGRGKYKGRLHARQGSRKRGSGRTARRHKAKLRRAAR